MVLCILEVCRSLNHQIEAICPLPPLPSLSHPRAAEVGPADEVGGAKRVPSLLKVSDYFVVNSVQQALVTFTSFAL